MRALTLVTLMGGVALHASVALLQRGENAHPEGSCSSIGVVPGIGLSRVPRLSDRGSDAIRPCV
jgi:hypothetical protein